MAGTSYITISITTIVVAIAVFAGLYGCKAPQNTPEISGISLTQNHMNFGACYSFYLRKENNKILFDAEVRFEEEPYCIILESCEAEQEDFEKLCAIVEQNQLSDYVRTYKKSPSLFNVSDETINKITLHYADGTDISAPTPNERIDVLYNFFLELAKSYMSQSVYTGKE